MQPKPRPILAFVARPVALLLLMAAIATGQSSNDESLHELSLEQLIELDVIPIDVLSTHIHPQGEWMISYQYMNMTMDGNRIGSQEVTAEEVLSGYRVSPTRMSMEMHMVEAMYGLTSRWTLMAMVPYLELGMDHVTRSGASFRTESGGLGDTQLMAHWAFYEGRRHRFIYLGGVSLPTGSIDETGATPAGPNQPLPYPMQLGSGTYDLVQGGSYLGRTSDWSWGADGRATLRLGTNTQEYALGDRFESSGWLTRRITSWTAANIEVRGSTWGNISGVDPRLNPMMVPTADAGLRGGTKLDVAVGLSFFVPTGALKNNRLFIDGGLPIYQDLTGPQLQGTGGLRFGWEWRF